MPLFAFNSMAATDGAAKAKPTTKGKAKANSSGSKWPPRPGRKAAAADRKAQAAILERNDAVDRAKAAEARARAAELRLTAARQLLDSLGDMNKNEATFVINWTKLQRDLGTEILDESPERQVAQMLQ